MQKRSKATRRQRRGAILSAELVLILPVLVGLIFAAVQFGLLWAANHQIKTASRVACREGTMPVADRDALKGAVRKAAERAMSNSRVRQAYRMRFVDGEFTGDPVAVEIELPMRAVAPNLLAIVGFDISKRTLKARTVMRKE